MTTIPAARKRSIAHATLALPFVKLGLSAT